MSSPVPSSPFTDVLLCISRRARSRRVCKQAALLCLLAGSLDVMLPDAFAQADASVASTGAVVAAPSTGPGGTARPRVGDGTTSLLELQVAGNAAAPALPMLGTAANLSWRRYMDSFTQPIPESFNRAIRKSDGK